jgi:hypothetical protein
MLSEGVSTALYPELNAGAEECWMEMEGGRMRYLRMGCWGIRFRGVLLCRL